MPAALILITVFFAMNMGASGIAPTFSAVYGGKILSRRIAVILFTVFVILGAFILGNGVVKTLSQGILPKDYLTLNVALIILVSAALSLSLANILAIPESTSMVTVGAVTGAAFYFKHIQLKTFLFIIPVWIAFPAISFVLTFLLYRRIYPPSEKNLWLYQKIFSHEKKLRYLAIIISCYGAFAVGTNNVANAVGPLVGAKFIGMLPALALVAPFFGLGAFFLGKRNIDTFGKEVVPLGLITSNLICLITGSLLIFASSLGVPFPYVQLTALSIFAISCVKNGHRVMLGHHLTRRIIMVWTLTPLLAAFVSFTLLSIFKT